MGLFSLYRILGGFIQIVAYIKSFLSLRVVVHGMDTAVCLTIEGHLECSEFGTLLNKMLRTFTYQFLQECTFSFSGPRNEQIVGMQFLGHMAVRLRPESTATSQNSFILQNTVIQAEVLGTAFLENGLAISLKTKQATAI